MNLVMIILEMLFLRAQERGIDIKMITDDKKIDQEDIVTLKKAGIEITC